MSGTDGTPSAPPGERLGPVRQPLSAVVGVLCTVMRVAYTGGAVAALVVPGLLVWATGLPWWLAGVGTVPGLLPPVLLWWHRRMLLATYAGPEVSAARVAEFQDSTGDILAGVVRATGDLGEVRWWQGPWVALRGLWRLRSGVLDVPEQAREFVAPLSIPQLVLSAQAMAACALGVLLVPVAVLVAGAVAVF
ncbi:MAG TPA: hypothetical protein VGP02_02580 [Mycobacteriales bacterium]|jgi:hypothetical protein|nr:hypothetical protein [Mycobacteriales bacterium]